MASKKLPDRFCKDLLVLYPIPGFRISNFLVQLEHFNYEGGGIRTPLKVLILVLVLFKLSKHYLFLNCLKPKFAKWYFLHFGVGHAEKLAQNF